MFYTLAIIFSLLFMILILVFVRNNRLEENYSVLWLIFGLCVIIMSLFPSIVDMVAGFFGVAYPPSLVFLLTFIVMAIYIIHLSVVATKQNKRIIKLTQEVAILNEKVNKLENKIKE